MRTKKRGRWMNKGQYGGLPAKLFFSGMIACGLMLGDAGLATAASAKKDARKTISEKRKAELRKLGREWCTKNYVRGSSYIVRVQVLSDGRVRCWIRG
jgi:hypothetical protein